ncbi:hypothetical protein TRM7557_03883 [Tritonibacter multivorans]|uniref:YicC-like family, N-terminal region n=1 Tax=Tritonibacter multivorans TaxID=928856 RepID=A0A0N7M157_9RHOB|nr:YicC/YloC family endoribonuclease [Tritonibacter multivorans]MDA7421471.1 YicC family protein [Tritonibacter multivorans]CUH82337.1 hypothetical protein TRM7557_03883 [Tritonibacter multivorans]SFC98826.1 TIGR00255 family protein [Tritonibacter multivorans]
MSLKSMTGFAAAQGAYGIYTWSWDIRSVNAKGLDLRLRVPDWLEGFENALKKKMGVELGRGNVNLALRLSRAEEEGAHLQVNAAALEGALAAVSAVQKAAEAAGTALSLPSATEVLAMRGVLEIAQTEQDTAPLIEALLSQFDSLFADFINSRSEEGAALQAVLMGQLDQVAQLRLDAIAHAETRKDLIRDSLQAALARVMDNADGADPERVAQELALLAVKADVTEELDRLAAHIDAARKLVTNGGHVGRKLDFLMQEFNREANTLCSKAQNADLTAVGLELKTVIDQMREQVQNIE